MDAGWVSGGLDEDEFGDIFDVLGVREHVDGLDAAHAVAGGEHLQVARLGGGVAAYVYDFAGLHVEELLHYFLVHAGAWRVGDDDVGALVAGDEFGGEHFGHIAGVEEGVGDVVVCGVFAGGHDRVFNVFDADDLFALAGQEEGDGAGAGVEVVDHIVGTHLRELGHIAVEPLGLRRVGLVECLRANGEVEGRGAVVALHDFLHVVLTGEGDRREVGVGVVELVVEDVLKRGDLGEVVAEVFEETFPTGMVFGNDEDDHPLAGAGVANDEVAQASGVVADVVEGELVGESVVACGKAYLVAQLRLEDAVLDVENLVEKGGDVET